MKKINLTLVLLSFLLACSNDKKLETEENILNFTIKNISKNENSKFQNILLIKSPSLFKNIPIDFDIYQVNYKNLKKNFNEIKYFTVINDELFRLGKGPDCLIFSREIYWDIKGNIISNLKLWHENRSKKDSLYSKNPKSTNIGIESNNNYKMPENIKKVMCK